MAGTVMAREELLTLLRDKVTKVLARRPEILFAMLYGSAAEGYEFRDLDIAVYLDRAKVVSETDYDYAFALADDLEAVVHFPVDVRVINNAPLPFRYNVSRGQPLLIQDPETYYAFLERAWDEYLDFEPVAMQYLQEMA